YASNYRPEVTMNHIYFTSLIDGAGLAAEVAALRSAEHGGSRQQHVYEVEPTGDFADDPNLTDKKRPGNPPRSHRSAQALRIRREVSGWKRLSPADLQRWRARLAAIADDDSKEIIN